MAENIIELNLKNFDKSTKKGKWIIDFWAEWCGPCTMLKPVFESAAKEMDGKMNFGKIDIDSQQELAEKFQVMSIPTILFLNNGEVINSHTGYASKDALLKMIKDNFG